MIIVIDYISGNILYVNHGNWKSWENWNLPLREGYVWEYYAFYLFCAT